MEPTSQSHAVMGFAAGGSQVQPAYAYPPAATIATASPVAPPGSQSVPSFPANQARVSSQHHLVYRQSQQVHQQLQQFWADRLADIEQNTNVKNHSLPLARIKRIMKADPDVSMISAEAPVLFAKACEICILELTFRSWMHTEENKRRILQKNDVAAAISRTDIYDFLLDIIPRDDTKEDRVGLPGARVPPSGGPTDMYPYYYMPQQQMLEAGMVYGGQQNHPVAVTYMLQEPNEQQDTEEQ